MIQFRFRRALQLLIASLSIRKSDRKGILVEKLPSWLRKWILFKFYLASVGDVRANTEEFTEHNSSMRSHGLEYQGFPERRKETSTLG